MILSSGSNGVPTYVVVYSAVVESRAARSRNSFLLSNTQRHSGVGFYPTTLRTSHEVRCVISNLLSPSLYSVLIEQHIQYWMQIEKCV